MNFFIERYRVSSKKYWLENIFHKMISKYECKVIAGTLEFNKVNMLNSKLTKIQFGVFESPKENLEELEENLKKDSLELWELLLLDSKDYLFKRSYRESIYAINGAFENYLMIKAKKILSKAWSQENAIEYLKGIPIYKYHKMKDYMDEKTFNRAVKENAINPYVPPVNQILKECNIIQPFTIPRKELKRLVSKIRKYRNEVMHGVKIDEDLEKVSFEAIKCFEDFVKYFN